MEENEKVKIILDKCQYKTVTFKKTDFQILSFIPLDIKTELWVNYVGSLYKENSDPISNYIQAEYGLELSLVNKLTNIRLVDDEGKVLSIDDIRSSGLLDFIKNNIEDYEDFRWNLDSILDLYKEKRIIDNSIGTILQNLSSKLFEFLNKLNELDISESGIKNLVSELHVDLDKLNKDWNNKPNTRKTNKIIKDTGKNTLPL